MTIDEIKNRLKVLSEEIPSSLQPFEKVEIEELYEKVTGKTFTQTSCNDCYRDACIIAYNYLERHGMCAEHRNYIMKNGACVQLAFGSAEMLCAHNCTDEKAIDYLSKYPEDITLFASYPDNWQDDCQKRTLTGDNTVDVQDTTKNKRKPLRRKKRENTQ